MQINLYMPSALKSYTQNQTQIKLDFHECDTVKKCVVGQVLDRLINDYPKLSSYIFAADGSLNSFMNVYLNEDDVRYLPEGIESQVKNGDEITLLLATAGG